MRCLDGNTDLMGMSLSKLWQLVLDREARHAAVVGSQRVGRDKRKRWLDSITDSMDMSLSKLWEIVEDRGTWHVIVHGVTKSQT